MEEYMLHLWGGAWNNDASPSIVKDYGITDGYHYFKNKEDMEKVISIIEKPEYFKQGVARDIKYGIMTHKRTIFVGTLEYKGKQFIIHYDFGYEYPDENAEFQFLENNYDCDCNRSLFIQREYGEDAIPELGCGNKIKLIDYRIEHVA